MGLRGFGSDLDNDRPFKLKRPAIDVARHVELVTCKQASQMRPEAKAPNRPLVVLLASRRLRMETEAVDGVGFGSIVGCAAWGRPDPHQ